MARAVEPFFTTKTEGRGSGLGLSMVYGFVKQSGGHLELMSTEGMGTTVRIFLPRTWAEESTAVSSSSAKVVGGSEVILVVEDDAEVCATVVEMLVELGYRVLQGARLRTTWTEFISCPSCGRTLFDLEETTARIKARTQHLSGVKIAIMGCIVNGPGEMADADFGYVGSGPGSVNLYVGKQLVERHVPQAQADDRLVALIREHGRWVDPA